MILDVLKCKSEYDIRILKWDQFCVKLGKAFYLLPNYVTNAKCMDCFKIGNKWTVKHKELTKVPIVNKESNTLGQTYGQLLLVKRGTLVYS